MNKATECLETWRNVVRNQRQHASMTKTELSRRSSVNRKVIGQFENGTSGIKFSAFLSIAHELGIVGFDICDGRVTEFYGKSSVDTFRKNVLHIMKSEGIAITELSHAGGLGRNAIWLFVKGRCDINLLSALKIFNGLRVICEERHLQYEAWMDSLITLSSKEL